MAIWLYGRVSGLEHLENFFLVVWGILITEFVLMETVRTIAQTICFATFIKSGCWTYCIHSLVDFEGVFCVVSIDFSFTCLFDRLGLLLPHYDYVQIIFFLVKVAILRCMPPLFVCYLLLLNKIFIDTTQAFICSCCAVLLLPFSLVHQNLSFPLSHF